MGKKIKFGNSYSDSKISSGSYEDMLKQRADKAEEMQQAVQQVFNSWNGQPLAIVMVEEDENGDPKGAHQLIVGAGKPESQIRLARGLDQASQAAVKVLAQATAQLGTNDMLKMVEQVAKYLGRLDK